MIVCNKYKGLNGYFVLVNVIFSSWFIVDSSWQKVGAAKLVKMSISTPASAAAMNYEPSTMNYLTSSCF
jgi:hypothetical protein